MRSTVRDLLPSMFHRRLLLLTAVMVVVLVVLGTQMSMLATGATHQNAREIAESKLQRQQVIQTKRGAILDRNGLVLAHDEPGWELAVHFDLLTGKWGYKNAYADASRDKLAWTEMSQPQREAKVTALQREYDQQAQAMFITLGELSGLGYAELNERRSATVERIHKLQNYLWEIWRQQAEEERGEPVRQSEVAKPIEAETQHHVLITDLSDELRLLVENFIEEGNRAMHSGDEQSRSALPWTMVQLRRTTMRRYPMDRMTVELDLSTLPGPLANDEPMAMEVGGVGLHLIGMMRDAWKEDVAKKPLRDRSSQFDLRGYADGDHLGRSGIEQSMELVLRGSRGLRMINRDTGETTQQIDPRAGKDVVLSIDIRLQAHLQALMSPEFGLMTVLPWHLKTDDPQERLGEPYNGAAVVIDIASGDVLAAVSMPDAPRDILDQDSALLWNDLVNQPMVNRAVAVPYQPGSTVKPLVEAAAVSEGVLGRDELIDTPGFLWEDKPTVYRDWYWKKYALLRGEINGTTAIQVSSNPFFGILAERLIKRFGKDRLPDWYRSFGLGVAPDVQIPEVIAGYIGSPDRELEHNEICFMAIGQGPIAWTPLQAATAYMRLASSDLSRQPRLVVSPAKPKTPSTVPNDAITSAARDMALEGMYLSANTQQGTTHHLSHPSVPEVHRKPFFNVEGVRIMAKSGTADPGRFRWIDYNRDGKPQEDEIERSLRDHAWVIALVQPEGASQPTHAIAVVVEYAGSGGQIAGPIANQIIHALQRHQYLDWPPTR
ncbi:MAG: penicillin-binding transpeptidase domain-containing protein [Phycisphaeraceae bacterium]